MWECSYVDLIPKSTVRASWNALTLEHCTEPTCDHSHILYIQFLSKNIVSFVTHAVVLVKRLPVKLLKDSHTNFQSYIGIGITYFGKFTPLYAKNDATSNTN